MILLWHTFLPLFIYLISGTLLFLTVLHYISEMQPISQPASANNNEKITVTGTPGEVIPITINAGTSVNGYWATSGITLSIDGNKSPTTIITTHRRNWPNEIDTTVGFGGNAISDMLLTGQIIMPSDQNTTDRQSFTGTISGDVEYPNYNLLHNSFTDEHTTVSISVVLVLRNPAVLFQTVQIPLYTVTGLGSILLLVLPALFLLTDVRRKSRVSEPESKGCFGPAARLFFIVAIGIFVFASTKPTSSRFVMWCATILTVIYALSLFLTGLVEKKRIADRKI